MERTCQNCPYYYVSGFDNCPSCHRHTDNDGKCWADVDDEITEEDVK